MPDYRVTLGVKYDHEPHPLMPGLTAHHYVTVAADSPNEARAITINHLGRYWAFDYPEPADGWANSGHFTEGPDYSEFVRLTKDSPVSVPQLVEATVVRTVERSRTFSRDELRRILKVDEWEIDRMSPGEIVERIEIMEPEHIETLLGNSYVHVVTKAERRDGVATDSAVRL